MRGLAGRRRCAGALTVVALAVFATPSGAQRHTVVLVSGLDSASPFSTPARSCAGKEGEAWGVPNGVAPALKAAKFKVFTAPVRDGSDKTPPPPCAKPAPGSSTWLNSKGDVDDNGAALSRFLAFLHRSYHVHAVTLVGHSDGGIWSLAAIATGRSKPAIEGLVTVGTPHTGSFVADVGSLAAGMVCGNADPTCVTVRSAARALLNGIGSTAVAELSSAFLATWNPRVSIGRCGVTTIDGTAIHPPPLPAPQPRLSDYYTPSDGLVGQASGADQSAKAIDGTRIPAAPISRLTNGGSFSAYHAPALGNPNELNDPAINAAVVRALRQPASACAGKRMRGGLTKLALRLRTARAVGARGGGLGAAGSGDLVLATANTSVSCAGRALTASPLLPVPVLRTFVAGACKRLTATHAAVLLHAVRSSVLLRLNGSCLTVRVAGQPIRKLTVAVRQGARWTTIAPRRGFRIVPAGDRVDLRITGRTLSGEPVSASALVSK